MKKCLGLPLAVGLLTAPLLASSIEFTDIGSSPSLETYEIADPIVPPGSSFTDATSIHGDNDIVGFYEDANGVAHGFIWPAYKPSGAAIAPGNAIVLDEPGNTEVVGLYKTAPRFITAPSLPPCC
jgi:hypothetical protein